MSIPKTITGEIGAYIYSSVHGPQDLEGADEERTFKRLQFLPANSASSSWVKVGTAQVTVTLLDTNAMLSNQVAVLRAEKVKVMADAQAATTKLEGQIQQLLAITNEVTA